MCERFQLLNIYLVEYQSLALERFRSVSKEQINGLERLMTKDNIALICLFGSIETGELVLVANTHIHWLKTLLLSQ